MANSKDMRLKIMACRQVYTGRNPRGDEYTIYEIDAANMQGQKINQKLRSFEALPIGQDIDVTVTPFDSERHGRSYTLHVKGRKGGGSQQQINDLREVVEELRRRNAALEERIAGLENARAAEIKAEMSGAAPTSGRELPGSQFGDDAGW